MSKLNIILKTLANMTKIQNLTICKNPKHVFSTRQVILANVASHSGICNDFLVDFGLQKSENVNKTLKIFEFLKAQFPKHNLTKGASKFRGCHTHLRDLQYFFAFFGRKQRKN